MKDAWCRARYQFTSCSPCMVRMLLAVFLLALAGCTTPMQANLTTRVNILGWGQHEAALAVPTDRYTPSVFDRLPDLSLITGIRVQDYQASGWRGLLVTQTFLSLRQLSGDQTSGHFLNKIFSDSQLIFNARWRPGLFVRELQVDVTLNPSRSGALAQALAAVTRSLLQTHFTLVLPGRVTATNGQSVNENTVNWTIDPTLPQHLQATARVVSVPFIVALVFTLSALAVAALISTRRRAAGVRGRLPRPVARPTAGSGAPQRTASPSRPVVSRTGLPAQTPAPAASTLWGVLLGLLGLVALLLGALSVLDGDWVPLAACAPGVVACGWGLWNGRQ